MELQPYLPRFDLFRNLSDANLAKVAAIARGVRYSAGSRIFSEGDAGDSLLLIVKGQVRISKNVAGVGEEALAMLEEGSYFGEMSVVDGTPRSADAYAHTPCALIVIERVPFEDLLRHDKDLAYEVLWAFVRTLSSRLRETNEKLRAFFALHGLF